MNDFFKNDYDIVYSRILLPKLLSVTNDLVLLLDENHNIHYINGAAEKTFRINCEDVIYKPYNTFCEITKTTNLISKFPNILEHEIDIYQEDEYVSITNRHISWNVIALNSNEIKYALIGHDITDKISLYENTINADSQISKQNSDSFYQNILRNLPGAIYWKDKNSVYKGCNQGLSDLLGLKSPEDIIGKTDYDLFTTEEAEKLIQHDIDVIRLNKPISLEEYGTICNGKIHTVLSNKKPLYDEDKNVIGILGVSLDIADVSSLIDELKTAKSLTEKEYETNKQRLAQLSEKVTGQTETKAKSLEEYALTVKNYLENIIAQMPGSVYWKDTNGVYLGGNKGLANLVGLDDVRDIVGKTDYDFPWKEEADKLIENDKKVMLQGETEKTEESVTLVSGKYSTYITNKVPLFDEEQKNVIGILGISLDITKQKEIESDLQKAKEQAEQANKAKTEFLANMSHDLRAPLHGILGMADILESNETDRSQLEHIHTLKHAGVNLLELIEDILSYSEFENKDKQLNLTTFNVNEFIQNIINIFSYAAKEKGLNFKYEIENQKNILIKSYPKAIKRILNNLLNNALKFTDSGSVTLRQNILSTERQNAILKLDVIDTGIGIPDKNLNTIFEKFSRVNPSFEGKYKGVGLGLSIVKEFIERINGKIEVQSTVNKGTQFSIEIPIEIEQITHNAVNSNGSTTYSDENKIKDLNLNALLIEDDLIGQRFAELVLKKFNCNVTLAKDGTEALQHITKKFDVIFSDVGLPDISGFEIAKAIKSPQNPNYETTLIAITGHAAEHDKDACYQAGFDDVLRKPLSMDGFKEAILKWFG